MRLTSEQFEEARTRLSQRPADAPFTSAEAAIYTGRSTRTLKRAIDAGIGPRREKNPDVSGLAATNRHTRYRKSDLDTWRESLVCFATGFRNFDDLATDAPWVMDSGKIVGHLLDITDIAAVMEILQADAVEFLRLDEALGEVWVSTGLHQHYQEAFEAVCTQSMQATAAAAQRDALRSEMGQTSGNDEPIRF